jgi:hypothetical protein
MRRQRKGVALRNSTNRSLDVFVNRRAGGITLAQWPNVALSVFITLSIAQRLNIARATPQTSLRLISVVAILV